MTLVARLGKQTVRVGSAPDCELVLTQPGIPPLAAVIIHQGQGRLSFLPEVEGICSMDGQPLLAGVAVPLHFQSRFTVGTTPVPLLDPEICMMVLARGHLRVAPGALIIGRDPGKCHLVMNSPGVSSRHATILLPGPRILDHSSTSGTWLDGARLEPEVATLLEEKSLLSIGPLPLPIPLALALYEELVSDKLEAPRRFTLGLPEAPAPPSFAELPPSTARHRTVMGTIRMESATRRSIGRTRDNDIVLDYPQISGHHARLVKIGQQVFLEDAGSELGTFVRGSRLRKGQRARVDDGDLVRFGPMPALLTVSGESVDVVVEDHEGWEGRPLFEVEARDVAVVVRDRNDKNQQKALLDSVSFKALPGDLIALMGPSGSGKTTLLHVLTGYVQPSRGQVLINGQPLSEMFDTLRGSIGYVPQDDIIHPELTVREAVEYSARFRLPPDFSDREIEERVDTTLRQLGLEAVAHLQIGRPEQKVLSGGQRKRVNIAMELVTDPVLLFLDEPTSGLAANDTTALVDLLAQLARESGKTIIATIHQPAKDEYQRFNLALILGHGGVELFFGPTTDAYEFFQAWRAPAERPGVDSPRDMFAELPEREARFRQAMPGASAAEVRLAVSRAYNGEYRASMTRAAMFSGPRASDMEGASRPALRRREHAHGQLRLLLRRYVRIKTRDGVGTAILLLQAPLIGVLLALVFGLQKQAIPYWCMGALEQLAKQSERVKAGTEHLIASLSPASDRSGAIFFLVVAAVWFGTSNAAREIVSERAIFRRERMINLGASNYVLSKFLVLSALCALQCTMLLGIVFFSLQIAGGPLAFAHALGIMTLTAICSVALGLLVSTIVTSSEAAMALTPIALIPQVVLGGLMVPMTTNPWLELPMQLMPARWGFEGLVRAERAALEYHPAWRIPLPDAPESLPDFISAGAFHCGRAQLESRTLSGAWGFGSSDQASLVVPLVLTAMTLVLLGAVTGILRRRR
jgi:ABC-type multidrug transport system ATPase subunit/pSer/pThr/pTyr-binding forkhead associated (FHA) protein